MKKTKRGILKLWMCMAALFLTVVLCAACGSSKQTQAPSKKAEPTQDEIADPVQDETADPVQDETTAPADSQPEEQPGDNFTIPEIPTGTQGVLSDYMWDINLGIRQLDGDDHIVMATWSEYSGNGALFDSNTYDTLAYVLFFDKNNDCIEEDGEDVEFIIVDLFAKQENLEQVKRYLPLFVLQNNPDVTLEKAKAIVETCLNSAAYSGDGMACYYFESDGMFHFISTCK